MKKSVVLSLGGSLIIPDNIDTNYLRNFKKIIKKNSEKYKFIVICGGGSIARKYISSLKELGINERFQSLSGISATRTNARFMNYFFNQDASKGIPQKIGEIKNYMDKRDVVFCGALEYKSNQTSDSTAAKVAEKFKAIFVNLTNVKGLYTQNPKKFKNAKFISKISWKEFEKMANKTKYKPGQHFVLDQTASKIIRKAKIHTYIFGNLKELDNLLNDRSFKGTEVFG